jgi:hypothetical protein
MQRSYICALFTGLALALSLGVGSLSAQSETANAEDGKPASEAPATSTNPVPSVPVGANLTPPLGVTPPALPIIPPAGTGQSGSSSVSMAPGSLTSGVAREGTNAVRAPEAEPAPEAAAACSDYPTWYDAQLALESTVDEALINALDPDGNAIACEEVMYPGS